MRRLLIIIAIFFLNVSAFAADGDIASVTISNDAAEKGWVAIVKITSASGTPGVGGTYDFGITADSTDLSTARVILTVTSGGYNSSGVYSASQTTRTVYGTYWVRKAFPDTLLLTSKVVDEALAAGELTLKIALSEAIYVGETVSAVISGGASPLYTQGGTPNAAYSGAATNSSTLTYPPVVARWAKPDYEQISTTTYTLEATAFHAYGIAAVIFTCTDAHGHTATATATTMTKSAWKSTGGGITGADQNPVLVYSGTVDLSSFTAKDPITCNFVAYPTVGNASTVADSHVYTAAGVVTSGTFINREVVTQETSGVTAYIIMPVAAAGPIQLFGFSGAASDGSLAWTGTTSGAVFTQSAAPVAISAPDERLHKLVALYDGAGTYGSPCAIVASTGQASALSTWVGIDCATARAAYVADNTVAYTNIGYAIQALKTYNNANNGHNDPGAGIVELTAGSHNIATNAPASDTGAQATWLTIRPYASVARADVSISEGAVAHKTRFIKISGISIGNPSGTYIIAVNTSTGMLWLDNLAINFSKTILVYGAGTVYATFNTVTACAAGFAQYSTQRTPWALIRGNYYNMTSSGTGIVGQEYCFLGNNGFAPITSFDNVNSLNVKSSENAVVGFNSFYFWNGAGNSWAKGLSSNGTALYNGIAIIQNLVEATVNVAVIFSSCSDANICESSNNVLLFHNSFVGERENMAYNTVGTSSKYHAHYVLKNNILGLAGTKGDAFNDKISTVSGITSANPGVVTATAHSFVNGDVVYISGVSGAMGTLLNGTYQTVANKAANTFEVVDTSSADACVASCGQADTRNPGRKGSWTYEYMVGGSGNYTPTAPSPSFAFSFAGIRSKIEAGRGFATPGWIDDACQTTAGSGGTGDGSGAGNYNLLNTSSALRLVLNGKQILPFDIVGHPRRNNGTGAAGAYEYRGKIGGIDSAYKVGGVAYPASIGGVY